MAFSLAFRSARVQRPSEFLAAAISSDWQQGKVTGLLLILSRIGRLFSANLSHASS
jgi:hypothetical protein